ncbi:peptidase family M28 family [Teratosphaeria destructans]|uniref:Peptidase family M28 family n=1 Tax=Teratosphaeria destructans TaxID=418781 RepID=A0A9W7T1H6_9PEZI|nr:peptidase family M28 family [Teratosphaeria destructans]
MPKPDSGQSLRQAAAVQLEQAKIEAHLTLCRKLQNDLVPTLSPPANDYLVWEPRVIKATDGQISGPRYFGEPDDELDGNWHELLEPSNTGVPAEWMHDLGREKEGVQLPEGTYFGVMAVFHNLHCLKHVQRALHPEHYGLDLLEGNEVTEHWDHLNHCLYQLKHAVMCQGDTTLLTMYWHDRMYQPVANWSSPHECINWDRFMDWVVPNSVDVHRDGVLVHPKYGALMKDGEPTALWYKSFRESGFGKLGNEFLHNRPNNTDVQP